MALSAPSPPVVPPDVEAQPSAPSEPIVVGVGVGIGTGLAVDVGEGVTTDPSGPVVQPASAAARATVDTR